MPLFETEGVVDKSICQRQPCAQYTQEFNYGGQESIFQIILPPIEKRIIIGKFSLNCTTGLSLACNQWEGTRYTSSTRK